MFDPIVTATRSDTGPALDPAPSTRRQPHPSAGNLRPRRREVAPGLAARVRPISDARQRLLPVIPPLASLLPDRALRRGTTALVTGVAGGGTTLALALIAGASNAGSWCAAVGLSDPGVAAMTELGIDLSHLVLTPHPGSVWAEVVGELLNGVDVVLVRLPGRTRLTVARHLVARGRERQAALVVLGARPDDWPIAPDVTLRVEAGEWEGLGAGHGNLRARRSAVWASARRGDHHGRHHPLLLPSPTGAVAEAPEAPQVRDADRAPHPENVGRPLHLHRVECSERAELEDLERLDHLERIECAQSIDRHGPA
jgi:hypothetical protein